MATLTKQAISSALDITQHESNVFKRPEYNVYTAGGVYLVYPVDREYDAVAAEYAARLEDTADEFVYYPANADELVSAYEADKLNRWITANYPFVQARVEEITYTPEGYPEVTFTEDSSASSKMLAVILEEYAIA